MICSSLAWCGCLFLSLVVCYGDVESAFHFWEESTGIGMGLDGSGRCVLALFFLSFTTSSFFVFQLVEEQSLTLFFHIYIATQHTTYLHGVRLRSNKHTRRHKCFFSFVKDR